MEEVAHDFVRELEWRPASQIAGWILYVLEDLDGYVTDYEQALRVIALAIAYRLKAGRWPDK